MPKQTTRRQGREITFGRGLSSIETGTSSKKTSVCCRASKYGQCARCRYVLYSVLRDRTDESGDWSECLSSVNKY
jgi:hypothetical protein